MTISRFEITLRNDTKTQQLGSAEILLPVGFTRVSAVTPSVGTIEPVSGGFRLLGANLAPGAQAKVEFDLQLPCASGTYEWGVNAKQSNDYKGTGNDLTKPALATRQNQVINACALRFVTGKGPALAEKTKLIRADPVAPTSANVVSVEAVDGRSAALAERLGWFNGRVALSLGLRPVGQTVYPGQLVQSPDPVFAVGGVASFPTISITLAGIYSLKASTTASGFALADPRSQSREFTIVDVASPCRATCTATLGPAAQPTTRITGAAGTVDGTIVLSQDIGPAPVCNGYTPPRGSAYYEFDFVDADRAKRIDINYTAAQMKTFTNKSALEVCFATPNSTLLSDAKLGRAAFDYDGDGSPEGVVGLLPDCPTVPTSLCVLGRDPIPGGGASISFFAPSGLGDPRYH